MVENLPFQIEEHLSIDLTEEMALIEEEGGRALIEY
jgi:hypothetical protein